MEMVAAKPPNKHWKVHCRTHTCIPFLRIATYKYILHATFL